MALPSNPSLLFFLLLLHRLSPSKAGPHLTSFSISNSPWQPSHNTTLLSPNQTFASGFRHIPSSPSLFLFSIWVPSSSQKTIIWSLNPTNPVSSTTNLSITPQGRLTLPGPTARNLFPPTAAANPNTTSLRLTDAGDLVFGDWTSFSAPPTDTIVTDQPIVPNGTTLISGRYRLVNASALVFNGSYAYWGTTAIQSLNSTGALAQSNGGALLATDVGNTALRRLTLDSDGNLRLYTLDGTSGEWTMVWEAVQELCSIPGTCGANAICLPGGAASTVCKCPPGQRKVNNGCELKRTYSSTSKFLRLDYVNFPGGAEVTDLSPADYDTCRSSCLSNSSCSWFSYKFDGTRSCRIYFGALLYGIWSPASQVSAFVRVATSEPDASDFTGMTSTIDTTCPVRISLPVPPKESKTAAMNIGVIATIFFLELLVAVLSFWAFLKKYSKYRDMARTFGLELLPSGGGPKRFSYSELKSATSDFSSVVGHGGFGIVYRGELPDGRIVAVKKLKNGSGGGGDEFWGEVTIIGRMHHLNLVRMWGYCVEKEQRMLVYEYIPNGSLDKFLFRKEATGRPALDWNVRYRISLGVARAIAYLHEECLEWVLHCDIKPENILLEDDFCPKVSDFGLSKLIDKEDMLTVSRIRGTRGYLAPEWVIQREPITAKADVYSFGVVLLEMVTGVRNSEFQRGSMASEDWYLPRWAFEKVYSEKRVEEMLDQRLGESYDTREHLVMVERMAKTAMWCLQDRAEMRPSMGKVAKMLEGTVEITEPVKPTIFYLKEE